MLQSNLCGIYSPINWYFNTLNHDHQLVWSCVLLTGEYARLEDLQLSGVGTDWDCSLMDPLTAGWSKHWLRCSCHGPNYSWEEWSLIEMFLSQTHLQLSGVGTDCNYPVTDSLTAGWSGHWHWDFPIRDTLTAGCSGHWHWDFLVRDSLTAGWSGHWLQLSCQGLTYSWVEWVLALRRSCQGPSYSWVQWAMALRLSCHRLTYSWVEWALIATILSRTHLQLGAVGTGTETFLSGTHLQLGAVGTDTEYLVMDPLTAGWSGLYLSYMGLGYTLQSVQHHILAKWSSTNHAQ